MVSVSVRLLRRAAQRGLKGGRVLRAESTDPFLNIATEHMLFNKGVPGTPPDTPSLFLWRNSPVIILGKHQNPWKEIDVNRVKNEHPDVSIVRRHSGGGTVYQDLGNLCYTFLLPKSLFDRERNAEIVVRALQSLGFKGAKQRGRNDIVIASEDPVTGEETELKVSGAAYRIRGERAIHHGTMLVNADLSALGRLLTPSAKKLASKGISSVRSRVGNLVDAERDHPSTPLPPVVTTAQVDAALVSSFESAYGPIGGETLLTESQALSDGDIARESVRLREWTWAVGETPAFTLHAEERFAWAGFDVHLDVAKGFVAQVIVFSDTLTPGFVDAVQEVLVGKRYEPEEVRRALEAIDHGELGMERGQVTEFAEWLAAEIA